MRALVTGSSGGIGAAFVEVLSEEGYEVVATARRVEAIEYLPAAMHLPLDVTDADAVRTAVLAAGPVDLLVNNAGVTAHGPVERTPIETYQAIMDTNLWGAVRLVQGVAPGMRAHGSGTIVNISSAEGQVATPLGSAYAASKWALEALSESLHFELGHFGIRVMIVQPGYIAPGMKNIPTFGEEEPYDELRRQYSGVEGSLLDGPRPEPDIVARSVLAALATDEPPLRLPVGADAEMVLAVRAASTDAEFEAAMRATLGLTW